MQDHAIRLTHLHATAFINATPPTSPWICSHGRGSPLLSGGYCTQTLDYSRVKFVVHYFLGASLSESDHCLLNSAGTAARVARVRARRVLVVVVVSVESRGVTVSQPHVFIYTYIYTHWQNQITPTRGTQRASSDFIHHISYRWLPIIINTQHSTAPVINYSFVKVSVITGSDDLIRNPVTSTHTHTPPHIGSLNAQNKNKNKK